MENQVLDAIQRIPLLADIPIDTIDCERLGGLTNLVYRISTNENDYCLRIPGEGTESYIDRAVEKHNTKVAERAGVSPELYYFSDDGLMLTRYLNDSDTMSGEKFQVNENAVSAAGKAFRKLHTCGEEFKFRFEVFSMINEYLGVLAQGDSVELPDGYHETVEQSKSVQSALNENPEKLVPSHCDPLCENFIQQADKMWIVDWEYSGMNDPYWDLGDLSVEGGMSDDMDIVLLTGYLGRSPNDYDVGRMVIYKALCDLLWTLWGLIQHMNQNPVDDFWAYSIERFTRCVDLMSKDEFSLHLKSLYTKNK